MKRLALLSALFVFAMAVPAAGAAVVAGAAIPDRPTGNVQMIYNTNPAVQCFHTARDGVDLQFGLEHCDIAMHDPAMNYRAQTVVNRGIIRFALGDSRGALNDFQDALEYNPAMGDAYLNQALVLVAEKRPAEALAAINQGIALGATNLQVAYYSRGEIAEDEGHFAQAYRDYKQALMIKPDYVAAQRQLERFKVVPKAQATQ
jgi:tetratricopeptide (TPR) repeat protein